MLARVPKGVEPVDGSAPDAVAELARRRSASLLVDTLGGADLVDRSRWVRQGGRAVAIGYVAGPRLSVDLPSWRFLRDVAPDWLLPGVAQLARDRVYAFESNPVFVDVI